MNPPTNPPTNPTDFPGPTLVAVHGVEPEVFDAGRRTRRRGLPRHHPQRGYGNSSRPAEVTAHDVAHLADDLVALLDHYGHEDATFIGRGWGAMVGWSLALLRPTRVNKVICLSLPYRAADGVGGAVQATPAWAVDHGEYDQRDRSGDGEQPQRPQHHGRGVRRKTRTAGGAGQAQASSSAPAGATARRGTVPPARPRGPRPATCCGGRRSSRAACR